MKARASIDPPKPVEKHLPITHETDKNCLWVNKAFLRSLITRPPRTVLHPEPSGQQDYYLHLADIALGRMERRKADRCPIAFRKANVNAHVVLGGLKAVPSWFISDRLLLMDSRKTGKSGGDVARQIADRNDLRCERSEVDGKAGFRFWRIE